MRNRTLLAVMLVVAVWVSVASSSTAQTTLWSGYMSSGRQAFQEGRYSEATDLFRAACDQFDPAADAGSPYYAESLLELARSERRQGDLEEAISDLEQALAIFEAERGSGAPETGSTMVELAGARRETGSLDEAERLLRRAMAIREATVSPNDPAMIEVLEGTALVAVARGHYTVAETTYLRVLAATNATYPEDSPERARVMIQMAEIYVAQEKYDRALPFLRRAQSGLPEDRQGPVLAAIGEIYLALDDPEQAESYFLQSVDAFDLAATLDSGGARASYQLAELLREQGRYEESEPFFERALAEASGVYGKGSRKLVPILEGYSSLLWHTSRKFKASKVKARAKSIKVRKRKSEE